MVLRSVVDGRVQSSRRAWATGAAQASTTCTTAGSPAPSNTGPSPRGPLPGVLVGDRDHLRRVDRAQRRPAGLETCSSSRSVSLAPHSSQRSPACSSVFSSRSMRSRYPRGPREQRPEAVGVRRQVADRHERERGHSGSSRTSEATAASAPRASRHRRRARSAQPEAPRVGGEGAEEDDVGGAQAGRRRARCPSRAARASARRRACDVVSVQGARRPAADAPGRGRWRRGRAAARRPAPARRGRRRRRRPGSRAASASNGVAAAPDVVGVERGDEQRRAPSTAGTQRRAASRPPRPAPATMATTKVSPTVARHERRELRRVQLREAPGRRGSRRARRRRPLVGRQVRVPLAEHPEGRPERALGGLLVERLVDVRHDERLDRRRERLDDAGRRARPAAPAARRGR